MDGFDLDSPLVCEGVIGDGCGGGRLFYVEDETLKTYNPQTRENMTLLEDVTNAIGVSKKGCVVSIESEEEVIEFDLSTLKVKTQT